MLTVDPSKRIRASEAIDHPWIENELTGEKGIDSNNQKTCMHSPRSRRLLAETPKAFRETELVDLDLVDGDFAGDFAGAN